MRFLRIRRILPLLGILLFLGASAPARAEVSWSVSFSTFHDRLAPYGTWVTVGNYGRCWRPARVAVGWQPYLDGEWVYTDYGWTWVSYDPWGDIACHYGSWAWEPGYGWVWVPGYVWGPAWVTWCFDDDFIGWAPLSPAFVFTTSGYFGAAFVDPPSRYVFVPTRSFVGINASTVRVPGTRNATLLRSGTTMTRFSVSRNFVHSSGPDPKRIERATGRPIRTASFTKARLHPSRIDAAGPIRGSRLALTSRTNLRAGVQPKTTARTRPAGTALRSRSRSAAPRPRHGQAAATEPRSQTHAVGRQAPSQRVRAGETPRPNEARRSRATQPGFQAAPRTERQAQPRTVTRAPSAPLEHAAPPAQTHAAPRVQVRPMPQVARAAPQTRMQPRPAPAPPRGSRPAPPPRQDKQPH